MTADELRALIDNFPNNSKRHHHALIRELATELLKTKFEVVMLRAMVDGLQAPEPQLTPCEKAA